VRLSMKDCASGQILEGADKFFSIKEKSFSQIYSIR
jgi:hypothetical protein